MRLATELECTDAIIQAALLMGWCVHHDRPARTERGWRTAISGTKGFPDFLATRNGELVVAEFKRPPRRLDDPAQSKWLYEFHLAGVETHLVFVPGAEQVAFLRRLANRNPRGGPDASHHTRWPR